MRESSRSGNRLVEQRYKALSLTGMGHASRGQLGGKHLGVESQPAQLLAEAVVQLVRDALLFPGTDRGYLAFHGDSSRGLSFQLASALGNGVLKAGLQGTYVV